MTHPYHCTHHEPDWVIAERLADGQRVERACVCEKRMAFELLEHRKRRRRYAITQEDDLFHVLPQHLHVNGSTLKRWRQEMSA